MNKMIPLLLCLALLAAACAPTVDVDTGDAKVKLEKGAVGVTVDNTQVGVSDTEISTLDQDIESIDTEAGVDTSGLDSLDQDLAAIENLDI